MTTTTDIKFSMVESVNGISYLHLGYIKPRPNRMIMPWTTSGLLETPLSLNVLNIKGLERPTERIVLINHGQYPFQRLVEFINDYNAPDYLGGTNPTQSRVVGLIMDDRELHCIRCTLLN